MRRRLIVTMTAMVAAALLLAGVMTLLLVIRSTRQDTRRELLSQARSLANGVEPPATGPDARYRSMPSAELGAEARRKRALNCCPCVRSLTQSPVAVIHSPGEIVAACPTMVARS